MNPYIVLGVPPNSDDQHIRQAYLAAIKQSTPETDPERFKLLVAAYERVKDTGSRHQYELFNQDCPGASPLDAFLRHVRISPRPKPLSLEAFQELLRTCSKT